MFIGIYVQTYSVLQDFPSVRIVGHIAHKNIWLLHVLPFCVQLVFPSEKIVCHIAYKDFLFLRRETYSLNIFRLYVDDEKFCVQMVTENFLLCS